MYSPDRHNESCYDSSDLGGACQPLSEHFSCPLYSLRIAWLPGRNINHLLAVFHRSRCLDLVVSYPFTEPDMGRLATATRVGSEKLFRLPQACYSRNPHGRNGMVRTLL